MPEIKAKIINHNETQLVLSASRKGGCANCEKSTHCGILFLSNDKDKTLFVNNEISESVTHHKSYKQGDEILLYCDDITLLSYICILFIPTLCCLLGITFWVELTFKYWSLPQQVLLQLIMPFVVGSFISRKLLARMSAKSSPLSIREPEL